MKDAVFGRHGPRGSTSVTTTRAPQPSNTPLAPTTAAAGPAEPSRRQAEAEEMTAPAMRASAAGTGPRTGPAGEMCIEARGLAHEASTPDREGRNSSSVRFAAER